MRSRTTHYRALTALVAVAAVWACGGDEPTSPAPPRIVNPVISSISPTRGAVGTQVQVSGSNFGSDSVKVYFGTLQAAAPTSLTATSMNAVVPTGLAAGMHEMRVVNKDGGADTLVAAFEVLLPPVADSVSPERGTVGTEVRIYGTRFSADSVRVFFGGIEASAVVQEGGSLFATAPEGLAAETTYDLRIVNKDLTADTVAAGFRTVAPNVVRVNGVTKPTGLVGMLAFIENDAFGDAKHGQVYFRASDGTRIQAVIADTANDWANTYIVTTVPSGTADSSMIWVVTATGTDSIEFNLLQNGVFSPSTINWTQTSVLPQPLQGLGAVFVPVEEGSSPANYVFALGGADSLQAPTRSVYRATVAQSGALGAWSTDLTQLPEARAYHATAGATAYTAAPDSLTAAYLYVLGGKDATSTTVSSVLYARVGLDGVVGAWQNGTPLPVALHGAAAIVFRGYVYLSGGSDALNVAQSATYRAAVLADGSLGQWEPIASMPAARSHFSLVNFGPYVYALGGETGTTTAVSNALTGTETPAVDLARINLRNGAITSAGWQPVNAMGKARSKHSTVFAGGSLLVTSGLYSGIGVSGSSENTYAPLNSDGTLGSWAGATNAETMNSEIGYSLYNQAMVTFIDGAGNGHILVLGGSSTSTAGKASAAVLYY